MALPIPDCVDSQCLLVRLARELASDTRKRISEMSDSFYKLKERFVDNVILQTAFASVRMLEVTENLGMFDDFCPGVARV